VSINIFSNNSVARKPGTYWFSVHFYPASTIIGIGNKNNAVLAERFLGMDHFKSIWYSGSLANRSITQTSSFYVVSDHLNIDYKVLK